MSDCENAGLPEVVLTPADIPGADLSEPYESHTVPALRWWLLCRGIKVPNSWKKRKIIDRIHQANVEGASVVDVDGSHLYQKYKNLSDTGQQLAPLGHPTLPLSGWTTVTSENYLQVARNIPTVTAGLVYTYLAGHVGRSSDQGAFRALTRGYAHWASGRLDKLEINTNNPKYCHIRAIMKPSMKTGLYNVYLLLESDQGLASVIMATCKCAAGKSASCTHVSAVLHALCGITPTSFQLQPNISFSMGEEEMLPVTSYLCQWKAPKRRKESNMPISEAVFIKHDYAKPKKRKVQPVEDYDPRPPAFRGTAADRLPALLDELRGEQLCISLLFDAKCRHWSDDDNDMQPSTHHMPTIDALNATMSTFKESLHISEDEVREIERNTQDQRFSSLWFSSRRYRITSSNFGSVLTHRKETPPDSLVLRIIQPKTFSTTATKYGLDNEPLAIEQYISHQKTHGHPDLIVSASGFIISTDHPFLGTSPDGAVYDPVNVQQPFGFLEIKCPYSARNLTPVESCSVPGFCCTVDLSCDESLHLKESHRYYPQVQGQMAIGERPWCDFVVFTKKGISVERVPFNENYWKDRLLPKLIEFYDKCILPEIVSPIHALGLPLRDLRS